MSHRLSGDRRTGSYLRVDPTRGWIAFVGPCLGLCVLFLIGTMLIDFVSNFSLTDLLYERGQVERPVEIVSFD